MYTIKMGNEPIYSPFLCSEGYAVNEPHINMELDHADTLEFDMLPGHPHYDDMALLTTEISVYDEDGNVVTCGRVVNIEKDVNNVKKVYVEGCLAYLNDTVLRPYSSSQSAADYFRFLITAHNEKADSWKQFVIGSVDVEDPDGNDVLMRSNTDYVSVWNELDAKCLQKLEGHITLDYTKNLDGTITKTINYLIEPDQNPSQNQYIQFGENLVDINVQQASDGIYTVIVPLGSKVETTNTNDTPASTEGQTTRTSGGTTNQDKVFDALVSSPMYFNCAAACGLMANVEYESNFNPTASGDGGTSYGLFQWHGSRKTNLINYCNSHGLDYTTIAGQMAFFWYELGTSFPNTKSYLKSVKNTSSGAYDAAYYFCVNWEVPANKVTQGVNRGNKAKTTYWNRYSQYISSGSNDNVTLSYPFASHYGVNSGYGYRTDPATKAWKFHGGVDIGAPYGAQILAAAAGEVTTSSYNAGGYGNYVIIKHNSSLKTLYAHASKKLVSVGQQVSKGQAIALVGSTGYSTGAHLHFEVRDGKDNRVNPANYVKL